MSMPIYYSWIYHTHTEKFKKYIKVQQGDKSLMCMFHMEKETKDTQFHIAPECSSILLLKIPLQNYIKEIRVHEDQL